MTAIAIVFANADPI